MRRFARSYRTSLSILLGLTLGTAAISFAKAPNKPAPGKRSRTAPIQKTLVEKVSALMLQDPELVQLLNRIASHFENGRIEQVFGTIKTVDLSHSLSQGQFTVLKPRGRDGSHTRLISPSDLEVRLRSDLDLSSAFQSAVHELTHMLDYLETGTFYDPDILDFKDADEYAELVLDGEFKAFAAEARALIRIRKRVPKFPRSTNTDEIFFDRESGELLDPEGLKARILLRGYDDKARTEYAASLRAEYTRTLAQIEYLKTQIPYSGELDSYLEKMDAWEKSLDSGKRELPENQKLLTELERKRAERAALRSIREIEREILSTIRRAAELRRRLEQERLD
ncbi:MAG: hypothetical protein NDJ89_09790 [Oligoflexia bacterium]|nr:hypothetical protein [Oligoflexia bacterium]